MKRGNVAIFVPHAGCPHACSFCDQRSISGQAAFPERRDVEKAARAGLDSLGARAGQSELAFFGGSFTAIPPERMIALLEAAAPYIGEGGYKGIRISTRPDAVDDEKLGILRRYHVTAVELGAQSMDDRVLALNGRGHTAADVARAARLVKQWGFELGLQMMTGLYGDTPEGALLTAERLSSLEPATVRVYPAIVLKGTRLEQLYAEGLYAPQPLGEAVELCARLLEFFHGRGVRVIRLGLHATESLQAGMVAGPWHPAFRELCESAIYLKNARAALADMKPGSAAVLYAAPGAVSKLTGQHRANIIRLEREFGLRLRVRPDASLPIYAVYAERQARNFSRK